MKLQSRFLAASALTLAVALTSCATAPEMAATATSAAAASPSEGVVVAYRRLTESQYRHVIADAFGDQIQINARFEPEIREERLQAIGNARASITTSGLEQYYAAARSIADQVFGEDNNTGQEDCLGENSSGEACAVAFAASYGESLFRRVLSVDEVASFKDIYLEGVGADSDHERGMKSMLVSMLMSPEFLFRVERAERGPDGELRLDAWSKASRISFLLWDTGPDAELRAAARSGAIHSEPIVAAQIEGMLDDPRLADGVRAFFTDMLQFEFFETIQKDSQTYPKFSQSVADSAREETLRFLVKHLVEGDGDYRDIFTSRETVIDRSLAYVYNVPFLSSEPWTEYTFPEGSERSGIISQVTFLSLFSHPAASSPTVRGAKLQEIFRCIEVPLPPPDVDFSKVQALEHGTVRVRLTEHMTNDGCSGCHMLTDPMGLALERFDGLGQFRTMENGALIDVRSDVEGHDVIGAPGVGQFLHDDPEVATCVVQNAYYYGLGRPSDPDDFDYLAEKAENFADNGYRLSALFGDILTDPEFYSVPEPQRTEPVGQTAQISRQEALNGRSF